MLNLRKYRALSCDYISIRMSSLSRNRVALCVSLVCHDQAKRQTAFESSVFNQIKRRNKIIKWEAVDLKACGDFFFSTHFCSVIIWELVSTAPRNWNIPCGFLSHVMSHYTDMQLERFHTQKLNLDLELLIHAGLVTM